MARLNLSTAQVAQLNEWLYGGPTDPLGIVGLLAANARGEVQPPLDAATVYEQEGERDFYLLLLSKNGKNLLKSDLTQKMLDALAWVASSLDSWEALGLPIESHQQQMRPLWNWIKTSL